MNPPSWFTRAVATPFVEQTVLVEGAAIHYLRWPNPGRRGIVLIHGGAAHAHWWTFIAPFFGDEYDVVALDLSGHGDSERRSTYRRETWAQEVLEVADHARFAEAPILIGHSMGGLVAIVAAALHGDRLSGAIIVDSPVHRHNREGDAALASKAFGGAKTYPDLETAIRRFRLLPAQPCGNDFIIEYVARHSVCAIKGGFRWKFDPVVFSLGLTDRMMEYLAQVRCPLAMVRGASSDVVPADTAALLTGLLENIAPVVEIPDAYHHLILDQPLAFVAATRALLAVWRATWPTWNRPLSHRCNLGPDLGRQAK